MCRAYARTIAGGEPFGRHRGSERSGLGMCDDMAGILRAASPAGREYLPWTLNHL